MTGETTRDCMIVLTNAIVLFLCVPTAAAALVATDTASDPAYATESGGAWKGTNPSTGENPPGTDNGGFGFQAWNFAGGFHYPPQSPYGNLNHFIDGVDFAPSVFNNLGAPSFGLTNANFSFGGATARATRVLEMPLSVGGAVRLDFDNPELRPFDPFAAAGFIIRLNSGGGPKSQPGVSERFGFFTTSGFNMENWSIADAAGLRDTGLSSDQTTAGSSFRFTLTAPETYALEILPLGGGAPLLTQAGSLANPGSGSIDSLEILMFENGSGNGVTGPAARPTGEREFFFNNLQVTSEANVQSGDYDFDGDVDGADLLLWQRTLGSTSALAADGNSDGTINQGDLHVWAMTFGQGVGAVSVIPEPALERFIPTACLLIWLMRSQRQAAC